ncbi:DUF3304 domain-containing protein [Escherichia coli]|nr:DUF3304 domain-containing protein [Escherichia coli]EEY4449178.1 DUF3304 domain-containing protein [Escherichia coli O116]EFK7040386.1 DUF3304 domain-containing protein [Escherichia coli]EHR8371379.1 DUF3304 domain-containing protein [Escherichia coli]EHR9292188.1 DUF3304 domain-containing protein [Escherichia coli]
MGLFTQLEKFDQKLTRGYARWGRWVWRTLIVVPVLGFSVNGVAGANAFANGGGSITCCGDVSGDTAEVIWTLSTTRTQYNAGMRLEKRNMTLPLPKREWGEDFLHVHFMPGDKVLLGWSKDSFSPYEDLHNGGYKTRVRQDVKDKLYGTGKMN